MHRSYIHALLPYLSIPRMSYFSEGITGTSSRYVPLNINQRDYSMTMEPVFLPTPGMGLQLFYIYRVKCPPNDGGQASPEQHYNNFYLT
jgi:hypothetical protein